MRADRLLAILLLFQAHGRLSARTLARRLEVSQRTVYRDLDALSTAGVPVVTERGAAGGAYLMEGYRTDLTELTAPELDTLLAFGAAAPAGDLGLGTSLESALRKLQAAQPAPAATRLADRILVDSERWGGGRAAPPHLAAVQDALLTDCRLRVRYRRAEEEVVERVLEPLGLVAKAGVWYLVARTAGGTTTRAYRVSRIDAAEAEPESFERPRDFDLAQAWAELTKSWDASQPGFRVSLRVEPQAVGLLIRVGGDRVQSLAAGEATLEFPNDGAARAFLASFGAQIEVIGPASLRQALLQQARETVALYEPAGRIS